jgi:predicted ATPase
MTKFVGRQRELSQLHSLLDDPNCQLVTLVGPGGIGKTRLAVEAAARQDRYRDGVAFVPFAGTAPARLEETADLMVTNLAGALGVSLAVPRDPLELLADHLAVRELLLVLDNLEHLQAAAEVVGTLLQRAPGVRFLVTSRRRLGMEAEWLVEVSGLPYPPSEGGLDTQGYDAVQLFEDHARTVRPGFQSAADEDVARICRLLSGVPLAIELAARWMRSTTPAAIADRLAGGFDLLATGAPDVERRHRSLRAVMDWSWQLLTDTERAVLARLSMLRGGFDLDAAAVVAEATMPALASLVDHSLIEVSEGGRYRMHEMLRQFAAERLAADPADEAETRRRHAEHYAGLLPEPAAMLASESGIDAEIENLRAAMDWLAGHADPGVLDRYLSRMWPLYRRKGWFREAQTVLAAALERKEVPVLERARWHRLLGEIHMQLGEMRPARDHFERTLSLLGSPVPASTPGLLDVLASQALQRRVRRLRPGGPVERREVRRIAAEERAAACWLLAEADWQLEEWLPLLPIGLWGLNQAERAGRLDLATLNQVNYGMFLGPIGLRRLANRHVRAAVAAADREGDPLSITWTRIVASLHWLGVGDWATLDARLAEALRAGAEGRLHRLVDQTFLLGAICRYLTGRFEEAAAMAAQAGAAGRERRDPMVHLWGLVTQAESRLRTDPTDPQIAGWLQEARPLLTRGVPRIDVVRSHLADAHFQLATGRPADAWRFARLAFNLAGSEPSFTPYSLEAHAGIPGICFALIERNEPASVAPDELRSIGAGGLRRLRRYARSFPMARPRALAYAGWRQWLEGNHDAGSRIWTRAVREAERLAMPWELAFAHYQFGRHLAAGEQSPLGLDPAQHLNRARSTFEALGCRTYYGDDPSG